MGWLFPVGDRHPFRTAHWVNTSRPGHLLLVETEGKERKTITGLIVKLALHGTYNLIAGDDVIPGCHRTVRMI